MSWKLRVTAAEFGRVRVTITRGDVPVNVFSLPESDYWSIWRLVVRKLLATATEILSAELNRLVWEHAVAHSENSTDFAMKRLGDLGITGEVMEKMADTLARKLLARLSEEVVPESGT